MKSHSPYVKKYQQKHDAFKIRPTLEEGEKIRNYATATNNSVQGLFLLSVREYIALHPAPEAETETEGKKEKKIDCITCFCCFGPSADCK